MSIQRLLALQENDTAIDRLSARKRAIESGGELTAARGEAEAAENELGELRLQIDAIAREQQRLEHEIDSLEQKAAAEERRLYDGSIANAKELESLQHEIANLKRRKEDREEEVLGLMERREQLDAAAAQAETAASAARTRVDQVGAAASEELETIEKELTARAGDRAAIVDELDPELVELYEDLRPQKKGVAAAALVDGVCQGCHEQLSAVELDRLKRTDGIKRCEHCRRILVP